MPEYNFQLRGWHAILAIFALAIYFAATMFARVRTVDDAMRDAVRQQLLNDYSGRSLHDLARIVTEARQGLPVESLPPMVQHDIQFSSLTAHGQFNGQVAYLRAEVTVDGGPPPDGRSIRYFSLSPKLGGGWLVLGEGSPYNYYRELLP